MFKSILATSVAAVTIAAPAMAQVTNVNQLKDVQPTDWAYQAIANLIDRYGCIAGYPNGTFKPEQVATRSEGAALVSACLDNITNYYTEADAKLAAALRAEFSKELASTNARVSALELAAAQKAQGVGNYVGVGVNLNQQGFPGNGFNTTQTISGAAVVTRYAVKNFSNANAVSLRPYLNAAAGPSGVIGTAGGVLATYDWSIAKAKSGVSKANVYGGVGYQVPFVQFSDANFQSAIGSRGQFVFTVGAEGRVTNSLVGYAQLTFPTTTASSSYGILSNPTYSPVFSTGLGIKF